MWHARNAGPSALPKDFEPYAESLLTGTKFNVQQERANWREMQYCMHVFAEGFESGDFGLPKVIDSSAERHARDQL